MSISVNVGSLSPIPDYGTLKTVINDWLDRDDLEAKVPFFVQMAEAVMNRDLRVPEMEKTRIITATREDTLLPSDFLEARSFHIDGAQLHAMSLTALRDEYRGAIGAPVSCAIVSGKLRLAPVPTTATKVSIDYIARLDPLTDASPVNWMLEEHADAYLYGALAFACDFLDNEQGAAKYMGFFLDILGRIQANGRLARHGSGPLVPNAVRQVRGSKC